MRGHFSVRGAAVAAAAGLACIVSTSAWAQQTTVVTPPAATLVREKAETYNGPNRALISTGLVTFGLAYVPAVIVAGTSPQPADNHLYIPVAGPWMNLADRPACGAPAVSDTSSNIPSASGIPCDVETTNKVLLGVDGVFQGIGALTTLVGLLSPEREEEPVTTGRPTVHVSPARMGIGGYGISAFGNF
jgi:hypothetical protein